MADVTTGKDEARIALRAQAIGETCHHFHGGVHEQCAAGVRFADVEKRHAPMTVKLTSGRTTSVERSLPCKRSMNPAGAWCAIRCIPTPADARALAVQETENIDATMAAMRAVHELVDGAARAKGVMACPRCGGTLSYVATRTRDDPPTISSMGKCATADCIGWRV